MQSRLCLGSGGLTALQHTSLPPKLAQQAGRTPAQARCAAHGLTAKVLFSFTTASQLTVCRSGKQSVRNGILLFSAEVWRALRAGTPVVALESTIISHGMPYPQNLETAQQVRWCPATRSTREIRFTCAYN